MLPNIDLAHQGSSPVSSSINYSLSSWPRCVESFLHLSVRPLHWIYAWARGAWDNDMVEKSAHHTSRSDYHQTGYHACSSLGCVTLRPNELDSDNMVLALLVLLKVAATAFNITVLVILMVLMLTVLCIDFEKLACSPPVVSQVIPNHFCTPALSALYGHGMSSIIHPLRWDIACS